MSLRWSGHCHVQNIEKGKKTKTVRGGYIFSRKLNGEAPLIVKVHSEKNILFSLLHIFYENVGGTEYDIFLHILIK